MDNNTKQLMEAAWAHDFTYEEAASYGLSYNLTFTREEYADVCNRLEAQMPW